VELLSPAGNLQALVAAVDAGADSVYIGLKEFSARAFASNFPIEQVPSIYSYLNSKSKRLYIAVNTLIKEMEIKSIFKYLSILTKVGVDAVIIQDFGIANIVNQYFPTLKLHASTQMSNLNSFDVKFLEQLNFKRVILDRQISFEELKLIKKRSLLELEIFIHGALCYSFAGQCYFSSFLGGQSANRGRCTQPCRRLYILNKQKKGYFFSPSDLSSVNDFEKLLNLNLTSLKIEGRMKSEQYVANVTKAYRILIDFYKRNKYLSKEVKDEAREFIKNSFGRKTTSGIYFNSNSIIEPNLSGATGLFLGKIIQKSDKFLIFKTGSELKTGDRIRIQDLGESIKITKIFVKNKLKNFAKKSEIVKIPLTEKMNIKKNLLIFKLSSKQNIEIPNTLKQNKKIKVKEIILPKTHDNGSRKKELYFKLNNIRQILSFPDNIRDFLIIPITQLEELFSVRKKLKKIEEFVIFEYPLFIFENELERFENITKELISLGFKKFLINSKSQLRFFDNFKNVFLILSERFHISNSFAAQLFLENMNTRRFILDFENDKKNLADFKFKNSAIITLYSNFPLLVSRIDNRLKSGNSLTDSKNEKFIIKRKRGLIHIFSNENFNIVSCRHELEQMGYCKFFFDISNIKFFKLSVKDFYNKLKYGKIYRGKDFNYSYGWK
jgi:putative protease